ncbi:MAG: hypothetical protein ACR2RA_11715 [Geminicoccaceae bacterium]
MTRTDQNRPSDRTPNPLVIHAVSEPTTEWRSEHRISDAEIYSPLMFNREYLPKEIVRQSTLPPIDKIE